MTESLEEQLLKSSLWLERLSPETLSVISTKLSIAEKEIIKLIGETKNQKVIRAELVKILNEAFATFETVLMGDIENITELAYNATGVIMTGWVAKESAALFEKWENVDKKVKDRLLNPSRTIQGHTLSDHLKHTSYINARKMGETISRGFKDGSGIAEISREIRNTIGGIDRNTVRTLTRTSMLEAIRASQYEIYDMFENEITKYYYNGVLDSRTSKRCWELTASNTHSKNKQDIVRLLDFHYNCRAGLGIRTALSEEFEAKQRNIVEWDGKTVNHRDGTKSTKFKLDEIRKIELDEMTPDKAFSKFSVEYQKQYMGKGRYELWKSGKAKFSDMIDLSRNDFIPLKDLKKRLGL